jgi:Rha family phage regulatory protein
MFNLTKIPQSQFVSVDENGKSTTDSLKVAEFFDKRHGDVLRDIESILTQVSDLCRERNFAFMQIDTIMPTGGLRKDPMYILTEAGFMLLAMGYTGEKAMRIKEAYINEFENMRAFVETRRDEYLNFLESQNKLIIESTTQSVMNCREKSRRLATNSIVADCDANLYRTMYRQTTDYKEIITKSKQRLARSKTDDHVLFGDLKHITAQLKRRLDYEDLNEQVELRELIVKANEKAIKEKRASRPQYEPVDEVDKLVESLISINAIPALLSLNDNKNSQSK